MGMLLSAEDRVSRARAVLERRGVAARDLLSPAIAASWARCLEAGLDPNRPSPPDRVEAATIRRARERAGVLLPLARAEMELLYHQIAGTNFMIAFAAADGMLLDALTDSSFSATASAASIAPGTLWNETRCGTNALGTTAFGNAAITVHGGEHFFSRHGMLTCTAAPVFDSDGSLAGVLDASSDCRSRQQHTRALVGMAAAQIENGLLRERHRGDLLLAFHSRAEYLHTLSAGVLALSGDGRILAANAQARMLLQGLPARRGGYFRDVFQTRLETLLGAARRQERLALRDLAGSTFAVRLENVTPLAAPVIAAPVIAETGPAETGPAEPRPAFVAEDPAIRQAVREVAAAAARRVPILIRGPTGTGKEQLARHAHRASGRAGAFVAVNCAALPETLAEAELFGHSDGAFTGARRGGAPGLIAEADGGTLFLDEIGDMRPGLQSLLLRFLDDWSIRPVGGGRCRAVDVLLVTATHVDLAAAIAAQRFRADLFYRLSAVEVTLAPLAERRDFAAIVTHLLREIGAPGQSMGALSPDVVEALRRRPWPGNIRELRGLLTRLTLTRRADAIRLEDLPAPYGATPPPEEADLRAVLRARVRAVHGETGGNISETARRLGVSRNTVYRAIG
jgi:transcriptional regulator of acetoin/glycerol metabolism